MVYAILIYGSLLLLLSHIFSSFFNIKIFNVIRLGDLLWIILEIAIYILAFYCIVKIILLIKNKEYKNKGFNYKNLIFYVVYIIFVVLLIVWAYC